MTNDSKHFKQLTYSSPFSNSALAILCSVTPIIATLYFFLAAHMKPTPQPDVAWSTLALQPSTQRNFSRLVLDDKLERLDKEAFALMSSDVKQAQIAYKNELDLITMRYGKDSLPLAEPLCYLSASCMPKNDTTFDAMRSFVRLRQQYLQLDCLDNIMLVYDMNDCFLATPHRTQMEEFFRSLLCESRSQEMRTLLHAQLALCAQMSGNTDLAKKELNEAVNIYLSKQHNTIEREAAYRRIQVILFRQLGQAAAVLQRSSDCEHYYSLAFAAATNLDAHTLMTTRASWAAALLTCGRRARAITILYDLTLHNGYGHWNWSAHLTSLVDQLSRTMIEESGKGQSANISCNYEQLVQICRNAKVTDAAKAQLATTIAAACLAIDQQTESIPFLQQSLSYYRKANRQPCSRDTDASLRDDGQQHEEIISLDDFFHSLRLCKADAELCEQIGMRLSSSGKYAQALPFLKHWENYLRHEEKDSTVHHRASLQLAQVLLALKKRAEAKLLFDELKQFYDTNPSALDQQTIQTILSIASFTGDYEANFHEAARLASHLRGRMEHAGLHDACYIDTLALLTGYEHWSGNGAAAIRDGELAVKLLAELDKSTSTNSAQKEPLYYAVAEAACEAACAALEGAEYARCLALLQNIVEMLGHDESTVARDMLAEALCAKARCQVRMGNSTHGQELVTQALTLLKNTQAEHYYKGVAYDSLTEVNIATGRFAEADTAAHQALVHWERYRAIGTWTTPAYREPFKAYTLYHLGQIAEHAGSLQQATAFYQASAELFTRWRICPFGASLVRSAQQHLKH